MSKCDFVISDAERNYFYFLDEWDMLYYYISYVYECGDYDVESGTVYCQPEIPENHYYQWWNVRYRLVTRLRSGYYAMTCRRERGSFDL